MLENEVEGWEADPGVGGAGLRRTLHMAELLGIRIAFICPKPRGELDTRLRAEGDQDLEWAENTFRKKYD